MNLLNIPSPTFNKAITPPLDLKGHKTNAENTFNGTKSTVLLSFYKLLCHFEVLEFQKKVANFHIFQKILRARKGSKNKEFKRL